MKVTVIVFSVLLTVCFFGSAARHAANNAGTAAISRLKSTTTSTKNDLERYGRNFVYDAEFKLNNEKIKELGNINNIVDPVMNDIRSSISAAKDKGKDAKHCYEPARLAMRQASLDTGVELDRCRDNGMSTINPYKGNIDQMVLLGSQILTELDGIAIGCLPSSNPLHYQTCIVLQIPGASAKVQGYEDTATTVKRTVDSTISSALITARSCNQSPVSKLWRTASDVRISSNNCIASS